MSDQSSPRKGTKRHAPGTNDSDKKDDVSEETLTVPKHAWRLTTSDDWDQVFKMYTHNIAPCCASPKRVKDAVLAELIEISASAATDQPSRQIQLRVATVARDMVLDSCRTLHFLLESSPDVVQRLEQMGKCLSIAVDAQELTCHVFPHQRKGVSEFKIGHEYKAPLDLLKCLFEIHTGDSHPETWDYFEPVDAVPTLDVFFVT